MISRHFVATQLLHSSPCVVSFCSFHRLLALPAIFFFRPPSRCTQCSPKSVGRDDARCGGVREPEPMADRCIGHTRADRYRRWTSNRAARMRQSIREKATIRRQDALVGVRTKGITIIQRGPPSPPTLSSANASTLGTALVSPFTFSLPGCASPYAF